MYQLLKLWIMPRVLGFSNSGVSWNRDDSYYEEPSKEEQAEQDRKRLATLLEKQKQLEAQPPQPANRKRPTKELRHLNRQIEALRKKLAL